ncbi:glutamyl-tRNA amidotransferase subunit A [Patulibacter medicamentivorans]|uniref:Glutamyl-tRNA amidotransferase subunit A n=1 Tax=Patulibacter medicamentivorans TaxID=1097667 RepID=H0E4V9_9ACTN|nr:amidase [Patulibacter medicamentivorans]EHN11286.1 glutamyl-tRNA amidotransferase subunit A [Patulibacter medicamentivorans]
MRDRSATAEATLDVPTDADAAPTALESPGPSGLSRRALVGRTGAIGAGALLLAGGATATAGAARARRAAAPTALPAVADVKARLRDVRLVDLEVIELAALLQAGELTSVEITEAYLARIAALNGAFETYGDNGGYNAFVRVDRDDALAGAKAADARLKAARDGGPPAPYLCGIPIGVKDSIGLKGRPAQNGTIAFAGNVGTDDGPVMAKLRAQGVVFLGHTICSAFSGSITGTFAGNAWQKDYFPGGSSQGSGVAPIARLAAAAIGEETGGSIIFPSAANGASGIKPSLGLCSSAGVMPLTPGHDVIGPISRSMRDSALLLNAMMGPDPENDQQTLAAPMPFGDLPTMPTGGATPLAGLTIGIPQTDWLTGNNVGVPPQTVYAPENLATFNRLRSQLETLGATVKEFPGLNMADAAVNSYFSSADVLERVDGTNVSPSSAVRYPNLYEIGYAEAVGAFAADKPETQKSALLSNYGRRAGGVPASSGVPLTFEAATALYGGVSSGARREGERRRRQTAANYQQALDEAGVDFMLVMNFGSKITRRDGSSTHALRYRTYYQVPNALGWPMVSFPVGYGSDADHLPFSVQFWGPRFSEPQIIQAAIDYQAAYPEHHRAAPPDPTVAITPKAKRLSPEKTAEAETETDPLLTNDPEAHEAALPAEYRPH